MTMGTLVQYMIYPNSSLFVKLANVVLKNPLLTSITTFLLWASVFSIKGDLTAPLIGDEADYIQRGVLLANEGFSAVADGYRPPFFIFIISALSHFFQGDELTLSVRLFNLALVSIVPGAWLYATKSSSINRDVFILMASFTAAWPPFFYFGSFAIAEGISFLALNVLIITTLSFNLSTKVFVHIAKSIACACIITILFLSKANNILIAPACAIIVFFSIKARFVERIFICAVMTILTAILIFPWVSFLHNTLGEYKLTTSGGLNLLVGTGYYSFGMTEHLDQSVLPEKYIGLKNRFHQTPSGPSALAFEDEQALARTQNNLEVDNISRQIAIKIWSKKPTEQVVYGGLKILHSLGGSLRDFQDYFIISFFLFTTICSIFCLSKGIHRRIIYLHWLIAGAGFFVAFFYLPDIRFKTFYFDSSALWVLSATLSVFFKPTLVIQPIKGGDRKKSFLRCRGATRRNRSSRIARSEHLSVFCLPTLRHYAANIL